MNEKEFAELVCRAESDGRCFFFALKDKGLFDRSFDGLNDPVVVKRGIEAMPGGWPRFSRVGMMEFLEGEGAECSAAVYAAWARGFLAAFRAARKEMEETKNEES